MSWDEGSKLIGACQEEASQRGRLIEQTRSILEESAETGKAELDSS